MASTSADAQRPHPIIFATQVPIPADFTTIGAVFGNHEGDVITVGRGGDLYILYPNDQLRNLTQEAGFGAPSGFQGPSSIAVREPCVHWNGSKAVFSMVIGAPAQQFEVNTYYWQLYEVTNLAQGGPPAVITKVPNQPANYNNVSPCYTSDSKILFTSDRPHNGAAHTYPQLDEYEEAETVSGLFVLDPANGALDLLDHSPSGDFTPIVDSYGRVIFSRWDHLQRDQQADQDYADEQASQPPTFGTFNYTSEAADSVPILPVDRTEVFPEARASRPDQLPEFVRGHNFNHFFPWMVHQDGSELETLNHIGRHELHEYFDRAFDEELDENQTEFNCDADSCGARFNQRSLFSMLHIRERPDAAGVYVGVDAPEFDTHSAGKIVSLPGQPTLPPDEMAVTWVTHPETGGFTAENDVPPPHACHSGLYRNPLPLSNGATIAVHAGERAPGVPETRARANEGDRASPESRYKFQMVNLIDAAGACLPYKRYGTSLIPAGIVKNISYWDPDVLVNYGAVRMWELYPVEVRSRPVPPKTGVPAIPDKESAVFAEERLDPSFLRRYLEDNDLALIVSRNVTTRDVADKQQPFNLRIAGPGGAQTAPSPSGPIFDVSYMQIFQGDLIRGTGGTATPDPGRRVLAQAMHDVPPGANPPSPGAPAGSVTLGIDGSMAALVPAQRALSWHLTAADGTPVVRERYWLTFQPGEIRVCTSCHGLNSADQANLPTPQNEPEALRNVITNWRDTSGFLFGDTLERGNLDLWSDVEE